MGPFLIEKNDFEHQKENFPTEKRFDISSLVANDADSNSNLRYHFAANVPFRVEQDGSRLYLLNSEELDRKIFEKHICIHKLENCLAVSIFTELWRHNIVIYLERPNKIDFFK